MPRVILSERPVAVKGGRIIGHIVRLSDGSSYFSQRKHIPVTGACVNYGPRWWERG